MDVQLTSPVSVMDTGPAILDEILVNLSLESDDTLVIETTFSQAADHGGPVRGYYLILPNLTSIKKMFGQL